MEAMVVKAAAVVARVAPEGMEAMVVAVRRGHLA
jgi:hypothetical protein